MLTPVVLEIVNAVDKRTDTRFWIEMVLLVMIIHMIITLFFRSFTPAWIVCYVIGMIYSRVDKRGYKNRIVFDIIVTIGLLIVPIQFRIDYWPHGDLPSAFVAIYRHFTNYGHVFLGIALVILTRYIYGRTKNRSYKHPLLNWSDKYSYDVYLVHHVFIQSKFGCVEYISNRFLALPLAVLLTVVSAVVLNTISDLVRAKLTTAFRRIPN